MPSEVLSNWKAGLQKGIGALERRNQHRSLAEIRGVSFCSNDYLGLARHPALREAVSMAVQQAEQVGGTGSRLLSGQTEDWHEVENRFATFAGTEAALFFTTGYAANLGLISALVNKDDVIFSDALNHASLIDGMRLSGARKIIYPHLNLRILEDALRQEAGAPWRKVIVTESVFSMDGDIAPLCRVVRKRPPEGFVSWGVPTFERLVAADPEPLTSSFTVSHAMLLNVIARPGDAFTAMRHLLTDNDEDAAARRRHIHQAIAIYRALLAGGVVERLPAPDEEGRWVRLTVDLQFDFALNQPLSPFALAAIELLDRDSPAYALDVLSVIEATLDNPRQVLSAQLFKARGEAVAQMKADGMEYEARMEQLDSVTYPRPLDDLLDAAYEIYRRGHPWVADYAVAPKSVVRDMYERAMTFVEYVGFYGLSRSDGLVLRYLADAYKALRQTVPED